LSSDIPVSEFASLRSMGSILDSIYTFSNLIVPEAAPQDANTASDEPEGVSRTAVKWNLLVDTALTFTAAQRSEFWAGNFSTLLDGFSLLWPGKPDDGIVDMLGIVAKLKAVLASEDDRLNGSAKAYLVIRDIVNDCRPSTRNGKSAIKSLLRMWGDVTVCHCAQLSEVTDCTSFLRVLDAAFGGQMLGDRAFSSQMQQSYHKVFVDADNAFHSKNYRRGRRPRVARTRVRADAPETPTTTDDSAAAASSDNVYVTAAQTMRAVECSNDGGVCKLAPSAQAGGSGDGASELGLHGSEGRQHEMVGQAAPNDSWYAWCDSQFHAQGDTLQCQFGHTFTQHHTQSQHSREFRNGRCPMCNWPLYVCKQPWHQM
jgi:hypothetical protein